MHAFVRLDAAMRLGRNPAEHAAVAARHAQFVASWLTAQHRPLQGSAQAETLAAIDGELPNIRAAWQWMLDHRQLELFAGAAFDLYRYHDMRGWLGEAEHLLSAAVALLGPDPTPDTLASG